VALVRIDISEESMDPIFRVEGLRELGSALATSVLTKPNVVTSLKTTFLKAKYFKIVPLLSICTGESLVLLDRCLLLREPLQKKKCLEDKLI
jgi:hypothetical protein